MFTTHTFVLFERDFRAATLVQVGVAPLSQRVTASFRPTPFPRVHRTWFDPHDRGLLVSTWALPGGCFAKWRTSSFGSPGLPTAGG